MGSLANLLKPERLHEVPLSLNTKDVDRRLENAETVMLFNRILSNPKRVSKSLHPSEVSNPYQKPCNLRFYYDLTGAEVNKLFVSDASVNNQLQIIFDTGTLLHLYTQATLYEQGYLEAFEVPCSEPGILTEGMADGVFNPGVLDIPKGKKAVYEFKTIGDNGFRNLRGAPKKEHVGQASIYADILGIDLIYFLYMNKNTSETNSFLVPVDKKFIEKYRELAKYLRDLIKRNTLKKVKTFPDRICKTKKDGEAINCRFSDICFKQ